MAVMTQGVGLLPWLTVLGREWLSRSSRRLLLSGTAPALPLRLSDAFRLMRQGNHLASSQMHASVAHAHCPLGSHSCTFHYMSLRRAVFKEVSPSEAEAEIRDSRAQR